ncbi:hypothetical protein FJTKL_02823 [Diaporthe vaccinii]|uniref:Uncharacterized protein n=1 Tax=Diaporthe vaccinii TaxID=105482 RepID=A0ABR4F2M5_9PEZI
MKQPGSRTRCQLWLRYLKWHPIVLTTQLSPFTHSSLCARAARLPPASKSFAASSYYQLLTPSRFVSTAERHGTRDKAGHRSETVRVMIYPGKGDIQHNPVSSGVPFFPRTRTSYKTHKKGKHITLTPFLCVPTRVFVISTEVVRN